MNLSEMSKKSRAFFANLEKTVGQIFWGIRDSEELPKTRDGFKDWAKQRVEVSKKRIDENQDSLVKSFKDMIVSLGVNEAVFAEIFVHNRNQTFETLLGESIAVIALVLAWNKQDEKEFSQTLGEIGAASLFSLNPITGLITVVGLALGYQRLIHPQSIKKGALVSIVGLSVSAIVPGGAVVSLVAALVAVIIVNKKISNERPIREQIVEIANRLWKNRKT